MNAVFESYDRFMSYVFLTGAALAAIGVFIDWLRGKQ